MLVALNGDYWYRPRDLPKKAPKDPWPVVRHLPERGAEYALSIACAAGDEPRVDAILAATPNQARALDAGARSPLSYATRNGFRVIVEKLLDLGADPNRPEQNAPRGAALFSACAGNHLKTAQRLLERGADPNAEVDSSGSCYTIVEFNHKKNGRPLQKILLAHGAKIPPYAMSDEELEAALQEAGASATHSQFLHELMGRNNPELIRTFLRRAPDASRRFLLTDIWGGNYPSDPASIRALAARGMDLQKGNWIGRTFLHGCAEKGDISAARIFLQLGADIEAIEFEHGGTPLGAAARASQKEMVHFLLAEGADAAAKAGHTAVVELLKNHLSGSPS